jgi:hypothetical protein
MPITPAGLAAAITAEQGAAANPTIQNDANMKLATAIINYLVANTVVTATIEPGTIITTGSPTTQAGPAAPVPLTGTID